MQSNDGSDFDPKPGAETPKAPLNSIFLNKLVIQGFRRFARAEVSLSPGLTVIVGENNSGKTAIVDAIRALTSDYSIVSDDFHRISEAKYSTEVLVEAIYSNLSLQDEATFIDALVPGDDGSFDARLQLRSEMRNDQVITHAEIGNGTSERVREIRSLMRLVYLQPLRDPAGPYGLQPGRRSQLARLVKQFAEDSEEKDLEEFVKGTNATLREKKPIRDARKQLAENLAALSSPQYPQNPDLVFTAPEFDRIVGSLEAEAHGMPINLNGLGASNLYYIAAVLSDLERDDSTRLRLLIIEEPEAHLHPHFQLLLLRFLRRATTWRNRVQVILTTHSPILASKAATESITPIRLSGKTTVATPVLTDRTSPQGMRVQQYLDATRSDLFFARRLIMVEGDSELLLLHELARHAGLNLAEAGVSVINVAGLTFDIFLPFVKGEVLGIPVAILTDGDPPTLPQNGHEAENAAEVTETPVGSAYSRGLVAAIAGDPCVEAFVSNRTFEYDLACPKDNRDILLHALEQTVGTKTLSNISEALSKAADDEWAAEFYTELFVRRTRISKPRFAQELALLLEKLEPGQFTVPKYICDAVTHVRPKTVEIAANGG